MTTPDHPDERTEDVTATEPTTPAVPAQQPSPYPISSSLSARLAELEGDDDTLFDDDDDEDDDEYDEAPAPVSYRPSDEEAAPTSHDDSAFTAGRDADVADVAAVAPVTAAGIAAPPVIPAVPVDVQPAAEPEPTPEGEPETAPDAEPAEATPVAGRGRRARRRRMSVPVVALLLMTVLMAAATAFLWLQVLENERTEDARREGLNASRDAARLLFSYDYRTLDKDFATGRALTTGEFRNQYDKTTTKVVADVAKQYKAVVKANVVGAGVVRATPDTVVTVVYVNQVTTSTRVTGEKVDLSRVRMTLHRSGGKWLVTSVNAL